MADKDERTGAVDVRLVPVVAVLIQILLGIDPGKRIAKRRLEGRRRIFQFEYDCFRIRRFDGIDHRVERLAGTRNTFRREDDLIPARLHVRRTERCTIMEFDTGADLERVNRSVFGRLRHATDAQITNEI